MLRLNTHFLAVQIWSPRKETVSLQREYANAPVFFFLGQWPHLNLFMQHIVCTWAYLTQDTMCSQSADLELLSSAASLSTYDSRLQGININHPQRLYPSSHDLPSSGCPSPLPNFSNLTPHSCVHTGNLAYRLRAPPALHTDIV